MNLLVSGGGTGGHIYPAIALIQKVMEKDPNSQILYVGTRKGLENKIIPDAKINFRTIEIQGFKRSLSFKNIQTVYLFFKAIKESKKIINEFKPDVVLGTGGYVCGPVVYAAHLMNIPTVIHEQNSIAGVTNKFLSNFVNKIAICFNDVSTCFPKSNRKKIVFTGNPRAEQVAMLSNNHLLKKYGLSDSLKTVLIFGGSRGAEKINQATINLIKFLSGKNYQILFVTGRAHYQNIIHKLNNISLPSNFIVLPYIDDMPNILPEISLIVGRAGATSLAEITSLGLPAILIPSPYVTHDHQTKNAMSLVNKNAALLIKESDLDENVLIDRIDYLMNHNDERIEMSKNASKMGVTDSADRLYNVLNELVIK